MSDIVDQLRGAYSTIFERSLAREAADTIEQLRARIAELDELLRDRENDLQFEHERSRINEAMAECMVMTRDGFIEAGLIDESVVPMFVVEAVLGAVARQSLKENQ